MEQDNWYFTADPHFGHGNIIQYCNRPFATPEEMDEAIISNWNAKVPEKGAKVFVVGDFCFHSDPRKYLTRLNGEVVLIKGNHDLRKPILQHFRQNFDLLTLRVSFMDQPTKLTLCHYAMRTWPSSHHGSLHLFGHSHGMVAGYGMSFDCGVDPNNYTPLSMQEVLNKFEAKIKLKEVPGCTSETS